MRVNFIKIAAVALVIASFFSFALPDGLHAQVPKLLDAPVEEGISNFVARTLSSSGITAADRQLPVLQLFTDTIIPNLAGMAALKIAPFGPLVIDGFLCERTATSMFLKMGIANLPVPRVKIGIPSDDGMFNRICSRMETVLSDLADDESGAETALLVYSLFYGTAAHLLYYIGQNADGADGRIDVVDFLSICGDVLDGMIAVNGYFRNVEDGAPIRNFSDDLSGRQTRIARQLDYQVGRAVDTLMALIARTYYSAVRSEANPRLYGPGFAEITRKMGKLFDLLGRETEADLMKDGWLTPYENVVDPWFATRAAGFLTGTDRGEF